MTRPVEIFVVGSLNADLVMSVKRRPRPGETVLGGDLRTFAGGKGANQAVAAARLGAATSILGAVGDDEHGRLLRQSLICAGVQCEYLRTVSDQPTGAAFITVTPDGENEIIVSPGANAAVTRSDIDAAEHAITQAAVLLCQLELPAAAVEHAAQVAEAAGVRVVLNAAPPQPLSPRLVGVCDPLVVNRHEAGSLTGDPTEQDVSALMPKLLTLGPRSAVITLGGDGAICGDSTGICHLPAPTVHVIDTTAAGDAFAGALAVELARGASLPAATKVAVRAGAAAVRRAGTQASLPDRAAIDAQS